MRLPNSVRRDEAGEAGCRSFGRIEPAYDDLRFATLVIDVSFREDNRSCLYQLGICCECFGEQYALNAAHTILKRDNRHLLSCIATILQ
ncbi:MAG: hypothetical protein MK095_02625, partial [Phycisphaerales bacterium]|nr:hypothetical protein [Phycisphaerales bacterium]